MNKIHQLLILCFVFSLQLPAPIILANEIPKLFRSPRALGMGNTGISIIDDEGAQFYNPANIATGKSRFKKLVVISPMIEVSEEFLNVYKDVTGAGQNPSAIIKKIQGRGYPPYHTAIQNYTGIVFKKTAFGIIANAETNARVKLMGFNLTANAGASVTIGPLLSVAHGFLNDTLLVGATGKYLYRGAFDQKADLNFILRKEYQGYKPMDHLARGSAFGSDVGITYKMEKEDGTPTFGLTVKDLGNTTFGESLDPEVDSLQAIPMTINFGFSLYPSTRTTTIVLGMDFLDMASKMQKDIFKKLHLGAELRFRDLLGARAGFNQGWPTFGGFISAKVFKIEGGVYTEEVGEKAGTDGDKRYFLQISAGY